MFMLMFMLIITTIREGLFMLQKSDSRRKKKNCTNCPKRNEKLNRVIIINSITFIILMFNNPSVPFRHTFNINDNLNEFQLRKFLILIFPSALEIRKLLISESNEKVSKCKRAKTKKANKINKIPIIIK
jgi:hypothetical protein